MTDQQWREALRCAGNPYVQTPNLDRLAARGVRFTKSYCTNPLCSPSRASIFTSRMPHELDIFLNMQCDLSKKGVPTMGELFQAAGYETAYAGKWHLETPFPAHAKTRIPGFQVLPLKGENPHKVEPAKYGRSLTADPQTAEAAIEFLRRPHEKPFLLVASLLNPHDICEFESCAAVRALLPEDPEQLPPARPNLRDSDELPSEARRFRPRWPESKWREYLGAYYRLVEKADAEAGRILSAMEQAGLDASTIVVFTSDHGEMMGSHQAITKQAIYEEAVAVPLIIAEPGARAGVNAGYLVSGLDILPTMLDYAGIPAPPSLLGRSLRPLVEGKEVLWREFLVAENAIPDVRMVRTARYKYILYSQGSDPEQFFDLANDPGELKNLIARPVLGGEIARHRRLLQEWMQETKDAFGKMPARTSPGGAGKKIGKIADAVQAKVPGSARSGR
jgi:arylsulfatase A-like enzyme